MSYVIGICGGSGAGKTTLARGLCGELGKENCAYLTLDNYYYDFVNRGMDPASVNYDHPDSLEFNLLCKNLSELQLGKAIQSPEYDFSSHTRRPNMQHVEARKYVIVEGLFLFTISKLNDLFDFRVFIDLPEQERFQRRKLRDLNERGRSFESIMKQYRNQVLPMHNKFVEPNKAVSQLTLNGAESIPNLIEQILSRLKLENIS